MPSPTSRPDGFFQEVAAAGRCDAASGARHGHVRDGRRRARGGARSGRPSTPTVVGGFTRRVRHPSPSSSTTGVGAGGRRTRDETHRGHEPLGLGGHVVEAGAVGEHARRTEWCPRSASGSGYWPLGRRLTRARARRTGRGRSGPSLSTATPNEGSERSTKRWAHTSNLARPTSSTGGWGGARARTGCRSGGVGAHVERERHRQQVLSMLPVELDVDVEPGLIRPAACT
jgi:hypothetical protein